ncbi:hypothetical protein SEA_NIEBRUSAYLOR_89 [Mycobacterium phage NiebruSaylor]|nr:hypothetical protein SEA_KRILI_89 [Mycobacterium phage Krili]QOC59288.1 hypothetical protein SEA_NIEBRUSAYLOR_89 [Mycobacterium phage NiebruSaylor]
MKVEDSSPGRTSLSVPASPCSETEHPTTRKDPAMRTCLVCGTPIKEPIGRGRPTELCSDKCRAERKMQQRSESRRRAIARGIPAHLHGTSTGSTYYRCSCDKCREWSRTYQQARRRGQLATEGR